MEPSEWEKARIRRVLEGLRRNPRAVRLCETCKWYNPKVFGGYTPRDGPDRGKLIAEEHASAGICMLHDKWVNWVMSCREWEYSEDYFFEDFEV